MNLNENSFDATEIDSLLESAPSAPSRRGGLKNVGNSVSSFFTSGRQKNDRPGHCRTATSIPQFMQESISSGFGVFAEDIQSAAMEIRGAFVAELHEADRGNRFFLDSGMMRSLAVLPEDMEGLVEEASKTTGFQIAEAKGEKFVNPWSSLGPLLSLFGAVIAISSNGTAMSLLRSVPPPLKLYWRMTATALFLSVFTVRSIRKEGFPKLSLGQWTTFGMAVVCFSVQTLLFVIALGYTAVGNALIYSNSQALVLLIGKAFVGESVAWMEGAGAVVAFTGAILCSVDSEGSSQSNQSAVFGDLLAFLSAIGGVGYLAFAKAVRPHMNVTLFMFMVMFFGSFVVVAFMLIADVPHTLSNDPYFGLFGWANWRPDRLLLETYIVIICNMIGSMGFVRAMQHLDSIIIAVSTLAEPMVASFIAYVCGVGMLPGVLGCVGNLLVVCGTLCVVYPSVNKGGIPH